MTQLNFRKHADAISVDGLEKTKHNTGGGVMPYYRDPEYQEALESIVNLFETNFTLSPHEVQMAVDRFENRHGIDFGVAHDELVRDILKDWDSRKEIIDVELKRPPSWASKLILADKTPMTKREEVADLSNRLYYCSDTGEGRKMRRELEQRIRKLEREIEIEKDTEDAGIED